MGRKPVESALGCSTRARPWHRMMFFVELSDTDSGGTTSEPRSAPKRQRCESVVAAGSDGKARCAMLLYTDWRCLGPSLRPCTFFPSAQRERLCHAHMLPLAGRRRPRG